MHFQPLELTRAGDAWIRLKLYRFSSVKSWNLLYVGVSTSLYQTLTVPYVGGIDHEPLLSVLPNTTATDEVRENYLLGAY